MLPRVSGNISDGVEQRHDQHFASFAAFLIPAGIDLYVMVVAWFYGGLRAIAPGQELGSRAWHVDPDSAYRGRAVRQSYGSRLAEHLLNVSIVCDTMLL